MQKLSVKDLHFKNKRVLLRVDFNVPMEKEGVISDDSRIRASLKTIEYLIQGGAKLILMSHLGRPKGKDPKLSLAPCAKRLSELLSIPVAFAPDCVGPAVEKKVQELLPSQVLLLENLRFHEGEEEPEKDPGFVSSLARLGDCYVNDAFGSAHRAHASTALIAKYFPGKAAAGFLMQEELEHLSPLLQNPKRPFAAILGGAKVSTKAGVIHQLLKLVDSLYIGGGMAFTFLKAQGMEIGASLFEETELKNAQKILETSNKIRLPLDFVIADSFSEKAQKKIVSIEEGIPDGWQGMDIGPKTTLQWTPSLQKNSTVFWNGPLGVFEFPSFMNGTRAIASALLQSKAQVIIGGGDSIAAIQKLNLPGKFSHLSTGGGASLEFLEYGHLPGIDALSEF